MSGLSKVAARRQGLAPAGHRETVEARRRHGSRTPQSRRLLSGLARCLQCGRGLFCERSSANYYYREHRRGTVPECSMVGRGWRAEVPEGLVGEVLGALRLDGDWLAYLQAQAHKQTRPGVEQRRALEEERRRAAHAHIRGALTAPELESVLADIDRRRAQLPPDIDGGMWSIPRFAEFGEVWDAMSDEGQHEMAVEVLAAVHMNVRAQRLFVEPRSDYAALFALRREYVLVGGFTPGRTGATLAQLPSGIYAPAELLRVAS